MKIQKALNLISFINFFDHMTNEIYGLYSTLHDSSYYHHVAQIAADTPRDQTKLPMMTTRNASPILMLIPP